MRSVKFDERLKKQLKYLFKKDKNRYMILKKKIDEISKCENPNHYKNLRVPFQEFKEVHIDSHFILIFRYMESSDKVIFECFCHHNEIFKW